MAGFQQNELHLIHWEMKGIFNIFHEEFAHHSHALIATVECNSEASDPSHKYSIKLLKQKQFIDGCLLILQVWNPVYAGPLLCVFS